MLTTTPTTPADAVEPARGLVPTLAVQRAIGRVLSPLWIPAAILLMRHGFRYQLRNLARVRALYRQASQAGTGPLLICANHLTIIDSALIAWGLGSAAFYLLHYRALPWNVPEQTLVDSSSARRALAYLMKCVPIARGGKRGEVAEVLRTLHQLLGRGEAVLMFPEGGRGRRGHIEHSSAAYGVGRLIHQLDDCRVLCVYLRGDHQDSWSNMPPARDSFYLDARVIEPHSVHRGMRASRDLAQQVIGELIQMEEEYFASRQ